MEFMMMIGLAMIVIIIFIGVIYYLTYNYSEEKNIKRLQDYGYSLQSELILASQVEPGYERVITIPDRINNIDYTISQTPNDLVLTYREADLLFSIPPGITGSPLSKGSNIIRKIDEDIVSIS